MKKILVTGGAGNVGGSLVKRLLENPSYFVVAVDNLLTGDISKLPPSSATNFKFIKCDVNQYSEISAVMLAYRFDYVFHYAAVVGVQRTIANPILVLNDLEGIKNILSLSKNTGVERVFYSSSSEVYGEPVEVPQNENTTPLNSRLPYAIVKNVGEAFLRSYQKEYGLNFTIFRFFNTYGPMQTTDFVVTKFLQLAIKNQPITIFGDGKQTRTFCYIDDNLDLTLKAIEEGYFVNDVVNVGNDEEITILELATRIKNAVGASSEIIHLPALKEGDMSRRQPDISKMKKVLNRELITLENGISKILDFRK